MKTETYKDLIVYNKAYEMAIEVYKATQEEVSRLLGAIIRKMET